MTNLDVPAWFAIGSLVVLTAILIGDLMLVIKRPHVPSVRECAAWVGFYVALALVFALAVLLVAGGETAGQFLAGWLTEYSLSVDNLFVFVLVMGMFAVPRAYQQGALMVGIIVSLVLRGIFIAAGAELIAHFNWIFYLFGAFLLYTAIHQALSTEGDGDQENGTVRFLRRHLRLSKNFDGYKSRTIVDGRRMFTPMLAVFLALGVTNLLFAFDSIPAIFGITTSAFIVFAANILALMGLRQLYFLLGHLLERLEYLKYGIAVILGFIGVKLVLQALHENRVPFINDGQPVGWAPELGTLVSLFVILAAMLATVVASLIKIRRDAART